VFLNDLPTSKRRGKEKKSMPTYAAPAAVLQLLAPSPTQKKKKKHQTRRATRSRWRGLQRTAASEVWDPLAGLHTALWGTWLSATQRERSSKLVKEAVVAIRRWCAAHPHYLPPPLPPLLSVLSPAQTSQKQLLNKQTSLSSQINQLSRGVHPHTTPQYSLLPES
jgi:hypothetical protein